MVLIADDFKTGKPKQVTPNYAEMDDEDLAAFSAIDPEAEREVLRRRVHRSEPVTASAHDLIWYENRRTPEVVARGAKGKRGGAGTAAGKVVKRRAATAEEEKTIRNGGWVRKAKDGSKPGDSGYKSENKSKIRPQNN